MRKGNFQKIKNKEGKQKVKPFKKSGGKKPMTKGWQKMEKLNNIAKMINKMKNKL